MKMLKKLSKFYFPIAIIFFFAIYFYKSFMVYDPDLGWHLRMGQLILKKGIPLTDPFSYTMPSYPFVDHEWLTNVLLFLGHKTTGMILPAFIFALLASAATLLNINYSRKKWYFIPFLLVSTTLVFFVGVRPQVITWFFFSFLLWILLDEIKYKKFKFIIPLLMLLWVNLHGGFAIGIVLIGVVLGFKVIKKKRFNPVDSIIFFASIAATLINPYSYRAWWEVWMQISDGSLRWNINEWNPSLFLPWTFTFWILFSLSLVFVFIYFKKIPKLFLILFITFSFLGISSMRHIPFLALVALPLTGLCMGYLYAESQKIAFSRKAFKQAWKVFLLLTLFVMMLELTLDYFRINNNTSASHYPVKAIEYLRLHPSKGEIFAHYNYGGYLIWNLPDKRVFIDGRMPSWRWVAPENESSNAFVEWKKTAMGEIPFYKAEKKYNIDTILWFPENKEEKNFITQYFIDLINNIFKVENHGGFEKDIGKEGFTVVYEDKRAVIYRKN